jgi:hypothetical protein
MDWGEEDQTTDLLLHKADKAAAPPRTITKVPVLYFLHFFKIIIFITFYKFDWARMLLV